MSTDYTHFTKLSFDSLFARGVAGSEVQIMDSTGSFVNPPVFGAGTVAAPSVKIGSSALGLFRPATDTLGFVTAGVQQGSIDSNGLWTIGSNNAVSSGSGLLNINHSNSAGQGPVAYFNLAGTHYSGFGVDRAGGTLITGSSAGDTCSFVNAQRFIWSTDNGTSIHGQVASGLWTFGKSGETGTHVFNGGISVSKAFAVAGTGTNDSAAAGFIGEILDSTVTSATSTGATTAWFDATSLSLTAGDWDVWGQITYKLNGATMSASLDTGIATTSGTTFTGALYGLNLVETPTLPTVAAAITLAIPPIRVSIASTTIHYLKGQATYSAGQPQYFARMTARRRR